VVPEVCLSKTERARNGTRDINKKKVSHVGHV